VTAPARREKHPIIEGGVGLSAGSHGPMVCQAMARGCGPRHCRRWLVAACASWPLCVTQWR